jgi:phospholipid transport system transporter-binding protein
VKIDANSLNHQNAAEWLARGRAALASGDSGFDLSAVQAVDSAAVALLLDWQRSAEAQGAQIALTGLPTALLSLAHLYGVSGLLGLPAAAAA